MIQKILDRYAQWKERRFLAKHGCKTREQYEHRYDPNVNYRASKIKDFYHGYPYVYCFENRIHDIYVWDLGFDGLYEPHKWCKENCVDNFRFDFHRAIKYPSTSNEWEINDLGGGDYIFFACKDPKDYTLFLLRWS